MNFIDLSPLSKQLKLTKTKANKMKLNIPAHGCLNSDPLHFFWEPYHHKLCISQGSENNEHNASQYLQQG